MQEQLFLTYVERFGTVSKDLKMSCVRPRPLPASGQLVAMDLRMVATPINHHKRFQFASS